MSPGAKLRLAELLAAAYTVALLAVLVLAIAGWDG